MRAVDIIAAKRDGKELSHEEIKFLIEGYVHGKIPDYQVSAFLMAVYFRGMSDDELFYLTDIMAASGEKTDLTGIEGTTVDKHSTGGVGDTTTLIVGPILASLGVPFAKMSGRGLGHTGGTLDKLESIPGFEVQLTKEDFIREVNKNKLVICGQTDNIAPADKLLYALRDVTATVESIPLIASSIMSKKLAIGCDAIVLDVKCGSGAFMKTVEDAEKLADLMVRIGTKAGKETVAYITNMDEPLGSSIGNANEVAEAIRMLRGEEDGPLLELSKILATEALMLATDMDKKTAREKVDATLANKDAYASFMEMVNAQKGSVEAVENLNKMPHAPLTLEVKAGKSGYVSKIQAEEVGRASLELGAGRRTKDDRIDLSVGLDMKVRVGSKIQEGDILAILHAKDGETAQTAREILLHAIEISEARVAPMPLVYKRIGKEDLH